MVPVTPAVKVTLLLNATVCELGWFVITGGSFASRNACCIPLNVPRPMICPLSLIAQASFKTHPAPESSTWLFRSDNVVLVQINA